jgi:hypothetical protein
MGEIWLCPGTRPHWRRRPGSRHGAAAPLGSGLVRRVWRTMQSPPFIGILGSEVRSRAWSGRNGESLNVERFRDRAVAWHTTASTPSGGMPGRAGPGSRRPHYDSYGDRGGRHRHSGEAGPGRRQRGGPASLIRVPGQTGSVAAPIEDVLSKGDWLLDAVRLSRARRKLRR